MPTATWAGALRRTCSSWVEHARKLQSKFGRAELFTPSPMGNVKTCDQQPEMIIITQNLHVQCAPKISLYYYGITPTLSFAHSKP